MGKLTTWLDALKVTGLDRHGLFPFLSVPENWTWTPPKTCLPCPQVLKPGHVEYGCGFMTTPLPAANAPHIKYWQQLQYMVHRVSGDLFYPYGAISGFAYTGYSSYAFAYKFSFLVTAVSGSQITIDGEGQDLRAVQIYFERKKNWGAAGFSILPAYGYGVQVNDRVEVDAGSVLSGKVFGRVHKVTLTSATTAVIDTDQDYSNIFSDAREDQTDPWQPRVSFIRHSAELEGWTPVVEPSEMKCHRKLLKLPAADLPEDLVINLTRLDGTDGRCADPEAADPDHGRPATLEVYKKQVDPEPTEAEPDPDPAPWEDISSECYGRLKRYSIGGPVAGADGRGSYKSVLCLGSKTWDGTEPFTPLLDENTEQVIIIYSPEIPDAYPGTDYYSPCGRRCVHSVKSPAADTYLMEDGEANLAGETWTCRMRRTREVVETLDGKYEVIHHKPALSELYTADCSLYGVCPSYAPIKNAGIGDRPFTLDSGDANQILKELTIGQDIALVQIYQGYAFYYARRVGRPTIHSLMSGVPASNPAEWSPNIIFVQSGTSIAGDYSTAAHPDGGTILDPLLGSAWDARADWSTLTFPATPPAGIFPTYLPTWVSGKVDALRRPWDADTDPTNSLRYYEDDSGVRAGRLVEDSGAFGRGVSQTTRKVAMPEKFLLEKLDLAEGTAGQDQDRRGVVFKWYNTDQAGPFGFQYAWTVTFKDLLPADGEPKGTVKTAEIVNAVLDGTKVILNLKNQPVQVARLKVLGMGNSFNETYTINAGGQIVRPPDPWQIRSSETDPNSWGGTQDWVTVGDSAKIDMAAPGWSDFGQALFTVMAARAYAGDKAASFNSNATGRILGTTLVNGYYQVPPDNLVVPATGEMGQAGGVELTLAADVTDTDVWITFTENPPFKVGQWLSVEDSAEVMRVDYVEAVNLQILVTRGVHVSHPAAAITAGKKIKLIQVYEPATGVIFEKQTSDTKPSLTNGKYWYDPDAARFYWSGADVDKDVDVAYYVDSGLGTYDPALSYLQPDHVIFNLELNGTLYKYPVFATDLLISEYAPGGTAPTVFLDGSSSAATATFPPTGTDHYVYQEPVDLKIVLQFDREHSGKDARIGLAPDTSSPDTFALDVADAPEFATGQAWGRNQDVVELDNENGWLTGVIALLPGKTITFERHKQKLAPDSALTQVQVTQWQADAYQAVEEENLLLERGRGILYGKRADLEDWQENIVGKKICMEIS